MLALLKQCRTHLPTPRRDDTPYGQLVAAVHAAIAGQPAPAKPVVDDAMARVCEAARIFIRKSWSDDDYDSAEETLANALADLERARKGEG